MTETPTGGRVRHLLNLLGVMGFLAGCSQEPMETADELRINSQQQALAYAEGTTKWGSTINTCFINNREGCVTRCRDSNQVCNLSTGCVGSEPCEAQKRCNGTRNMCSTDADCPIDSATFSDAKLLVQEAASSWTASTGVTFAFRGDCSNPPSDWLTINLMRQEWGGSCGYGRGAQCNIGVLDRGMLQWTTAHEIGHALTFPHEHQRLDVFEPNCADQIRLQACLQCTDNGCSATNLSACTCSVGDYNVCLGLSSTNSGTQTLTAAQRDFAQRFINNNLAIPTYRPITTYDSNSIMNYCSRRSLSLTDPAATSWRPSELDLLGAEVLYPRASTLSIRCRSGCFVTGPGLLLRSDGAIEDEWSSRGALAWWTVIAAPPLLPEAGLTWSQNGAVVGRTPILGASSVQPSGTLSYRGRSIWTLDLVNGSGNARVHSGLWTAIALTPM